MRFTLTQRLSLVFAVLLLVCSGTSAWLQLCSNRMHEQEVVQSLSRDLAESIARDAQLTDARGLRPDAVRELFSQLMVVNPSVEVYLLEPDGRIAGHAAPEGRLRRDHVDLAPVRRFLAGGALPIQGTDPMGAIGSGAARIFSRLDRLAGGQGDVGALGGPGGDGGLGGVVAVAGHRRLHAASRFTLADESASPVSASVVSPSISRDVREPGDPESIKAQNKKNGSAFQTGSEVDRRLRLMLFLSAHLGEEFSMSELAERFIGKPKNDDELKKFVNIIHKDINTLTTVSDDGEMAGSQFFDIDWPLLDAEGIVSATNSLGLERLAGISPQYLSMLTASVSYLAHSPLLPDKQRGQAESLYERLRRHVSPGQTPWLSLTGYELEPRSFSIVKRAINTDSLLDME